MRSAIFSRMLARSAAWSCPRLVGGGVGGVQRQFDVFGGGAGGLGVDLAGDRGDDVEVLALDRGTQTCRR
jgi:hypothetical protein